MSDFEAPDFQVGGQDRQLSEQEQLAQLSWYIHEHYPLAADAPPEVADAWLARLPDRLTHAAMMMLGAAVDHSMPGVAFSSNITVTELPELHAAMFTPPEPTGAWAVSIHPGGLVCGSGEALEYAWRPEVAASANLSGTTIIDVDYPLAPAHTIPDMVHTIRQAIDHARAQSATTVTVWGASAGAHLAALVAPLCDALLLTRPTFVQVAELPEPRTWPTTLIQRGTHDNIATSWADAEAHAEVRDYVAEHNVLTPAVARQRIRDSAEFLRSVPHECAGQQPQ